VARAVRLAVAVPVAYACRGVAILFLFVVFVAVAIVSSQASPARVYARLVRGGIAGRGILLQVSPQPLRTLGSAGQRFQLRRVQIDVELPGKPPYVVDATPYIPTNLVRDVLPGATVEIRVHRLQPSKIAIVGPGAGFAAAAQRLPGVVASNANGGAR
jgi:hypothetical protein